MKTQLENEINEYLKTVLKTNEIDFKRGDDLKTVIKINIKDFKESLKNYHAKYERVNGKGNAGKYVMRGIAKLETIVQMLEQYLE